MQPRSTNGAGNPRSPTTSGRAITSLSPRSQNRRSARSCAACWRLANTGGLLQRSAPMADPAPLVPALPDSFDGFRLVVDAARERADIVLDRPSLNVITMAQREQLRAVFEALDADDRVRVAVVRAEGQ